MSRGTNCRWLSIQEKWEGIKPHYYATNFFCEANMLRNGEVISQLRHKHKLTVLATRSEEATFLVGSQLAVIRCQMMGDRICCHAAHIDFLFHTVCGRCLSNTTVLYTPVRNAFHIGREKIHIGNHPKVR